MRVFAALSLLIASACSVDAPTGPGMPGADAGATTQVDAGGGGGTDAGGGTVDAGPTADTGTQPTCTDALEPNDNPEQASVLEPATITEGLMACSGNEDWYAVRLPEATQRVRVLMDHDRRGDVAMRLLSVEGEFLVAVEPTGDGFASEWVNGPMDFVIAVTNPGAQDSAYSLLLEVEEIPCARDYYEDNNSAGAARRIGGGLHANLTACGDPDYYRFSLEDGQHLEARVTGEPEIGLELLDDSGSRVLRVASQDADGASLIYNANVGGVYFLRVTSPEGFAGAYDLELLRSVDSNNTCDQAQVLRLGLGDEVSVEGSTRGLDNNFQPSCAHNNETPQTAPDAVYSLVVEEAGILEVWLRSETEGYDTALAVLSTCEDIASMLQCNDDHAPRDRGENRTDSRIRMEVEPGTYTIVADGWQASSGDFELTATLEPLPQPNPEATCDTARRINLPVGGRFQTVINVTDGDREYAPRTCAQRSGTNGREQAFTFTVGRAGRFNAYTGFSDEGGTYDTVLYLIQGCGGHGDELACNDDIGEGNTLSRIDNLELAAGTYTLVADAFRRDAQGSVSLTLLLDAQ